MNINFLKPDINYSNELFSIELDQENNKSIRFGLGGIKGVGIKSNTNLVKERKKNNKYIDVIDFMQRLHGEVINKRQLEKLIQAGAFDSLEKKRSRLFNNVTKFVELFGGESKNQNQNLLFEDQKLNFNDKICFFKILKNGILHNF